MLILRGNRRSSELTDEMERIGKTMYLQYIYCMIMKDTLWGVRSVMMFSFLFFWKFWSPTVLHNSGSISPMTGRTCKKCYTKHHC